MASIFSLDQQVANLPKHGFPMSMVFDFTSSCGHILPIYFDQFNPGEKIRYGVDLFTRTQPLAAPANVDIDEYIDVFFVPLKKISAAADNILFQISDLPSTSLPAISTDIVLPLLDLDKLKVDISGGGSNTYLGTWSSGLTEYGSYAPFFESYVSGAMRLFDMLQVNPCALYDGATCYRPMINPAAFAVYQAIYYDYFRLSNWQGNQIHAYNLDAGYNGLDLLATGLPWATSMGCRQLLTLHHRAWDKDYFTNVFPSPLISTAGILATGIDNLDNVNQWLTNNSYTPINDQGQVKVDGTATTTSQQLNSSYNYVQLQRNFSTASLRTLFAIDKLMKVTARAGKHYDDQVLAHFGFKVPKGYSNEVVHLGQHHQVIHIGEVISTASTSTGEIGELAGKGYGRRQGELVNNFVAPCHGYVMAVYSCAPRMSYIGGLSRLHTMTKRYDWFIPEIDNLGMQPLFNYELAQGHATPTGRAAWQLRYMQMKCKYNRATFAFCSFANTIQGTVGNDAPFAEWVLTDPFSVVGLTSLELGRLLVSPSILTELTLIAYDPCPSGSTMYSSGIAYPQHLYYSDPLIHHCVQRVSKISGMSVYGLDDKAI